MTLPSRGGAIGRRGRSDHQRLLRARARTADRERGVECLEASYCGCCGSPCSADALWCHPCASTPGHLGPVSLRAWDRTFESIHGSPCPFTETDL